MAIYYVDTNAAAGGDGTTSELTGPTCAWDTIADVNGAAFSDGDFVLFRRGCTWREKLTVPSSGSVGSPITFGAYGTGAKPIISGADIKSSWTSSALTGNANSLAGAETIGSTNWNAPTRASVSSNVATPLSPAGTQTVDGIIANADNNTHIFDAGAGATTAGQAYSFSVYAYPGISKWILLQCMWFTAAWGYIDSFYSSFNIDKYTAGALGTAEGGTTGRAVYDVGNHWKRISISDTAPALAVNCLVQIIALIADDGGTFVGDNSSVYTYLWGAKFENAAAPSLYTNYTSYYATSTTPNFVVTDDGARMLRSMDVSKGLFPNQFFWEDATDRLYIRLTGDANPSGSTIEAYNRQVAAEAIGKSYITFDGLEFTGTQSTTLASSDVREHGAGLSIEIPALDATYQGYTVNNCTFTKNGTTGATFWMEWMAAVGGRTAQTITFSNNTVNESNWELSSLNNASLVGFHGRPGDSFWKGVTVSGNNLYQDIAINPTNDGGFYTTGLWLDTLGGATVIGNEIEGCSHAIASYPTDNTDTVGTITKNYIHDTSDDCIWLAGSFNAAEVSYNLCVNPLDQFLDTYKAGLAAGEKSGLNIYNNVVYGTVNAAIHLVKTADVNIKNNIFWECGSGNALSQQYHVIYISDTEGDDTNTTLPTLVSDYNDVMISAGAKVGVSNSVEATSYTWANWKSVKSQDAHSITVDPLFVNGVGGDFRLKVTSPCKNAGVSVGLTTDYVGNPVGATPEIGAYEYLGGSKLGADQSKAKRMAKMKRYW